MLQCTASALGAIEEFLVFSKPVVDDKKIMENFSGRRPVRGSSFSEQKLLSAVKPQKIKKKSNNNFNFEESGVIVENSPSSDLVSTQENKITYRTYETKSNSLPRKATLRTKLEEEPSNVKDLKNSSLDECDLAAFASKLEQLKVENDTENGSNPGTGTNNYNSVEPQNNTLQHFTIDPIVHTDATIHNGNLQTQTLGRRQLSSSAVRKSAVFQRRTKSVEAVDGYKINNQLLNTTIEEEEPDRSFGGHKAMSIDCVDRHVHSDHPRIMIPIDETTRLTSRSIPAISHTRMNYIDNGVSSTTAPWTNSRSLANLGESDYTNFYSSPNDDEIKQQYNSRSHSNIAENNKYGYDNPGTLDANTRFNSRSFHNIAEQKRLKARLFQSLDEYSQYKNSNIGDFQEDSGYETATPFSKKAANVFGPDPSNEYIPRRFSSNTTPQAGQFSNIYHEVIPNVYPRFLSQSQDAISNRVPPVPNAEDMYYYYNIPPYQGIQQTHKLHEQPLQSNLFRRSPNSFANIPVQRSHRDITLSSSQDLYLPVAHPSYMQSLPRILNKQVSNSLVPNSKSSYQLNIHNPHLQYNLRMGSHPSVTRKLSTSETGYSKDINHKYLKHPQDFVMSQSQSAVGLLKSDPCFKMNFTDAGEFVNYRTPLNLINHDYIDNNRLRQLDPSRITRTDFARVAPLETNRMGPMDTNLMGPVNSRRQSSVDDRIYKSDINRSLAGNGLQTFVGQRVMEPPHKIESLEINKLASSDNNQMTGTVTRNIDKMNINRTRQVSSSRLSNRMQSFSNASAISGSDVQNHDHGIAIHDQTRSLMRANDSKSSILAYRDPIFNRVEPLSSRDNGMPPTDMLNKRLGMLPSCINTEVAICTSGNMSTTIPGGGKRVGSVDSFGNGMKPLNQCVARLSTDTSEKMKINSMMGHSSIGGRIATPLEATSRMNSAQVFEPSNSQSNLPVSILVRKDDGHVGGATSEICHDSSELWSENGQNLVTSTNTYINRRMENPQHRHSKTSGTTSKASRKVTLVL